MNTSGNDPALPFSFGMTELAKRQLGDIAKEAVEIGRQTEIPIALTRAIRLLQVQARECGDPVYDLRKMNVQVRRLICPPLVFEYGVHTINPDVIVRRVTWLRLPNRTDL